MLQFLLALFILFSATFDAQAIGFGGFGSSRVSPLEVSKETPESLARIRKTTDRIARYGRGSKSLYAIIGASPLIIAADLEARLGSQKVVKIPLSAAQILRAPTFPLETVDRVMLPYLDYFLESQNFGEIDQIIVVDFAVTGNSLVGAGGLLRRYLESRGYPKTMVRTVALRGSSAVDRNNLSSVIRLDGETEDLFSNRDFSYLRQFEKETVHQWVNWFNANTFSDEDDLARRIAGKIAAARLPDGEQRYQRAVEFFSQQPRANSITEKIINYCSTLLE